jgi:hypothetical protein
MRARSFRRKALAVLLIAGWVFFPSCSGDYCLRCVDLSSVRPDIEGCDNDLEGLQTASDFWEGEGFACIIFEN